MPVAVVTGAASGIGRATAIHLAELGYKCVLHTRQNLKGLLETASEAEKLYRQSKRNDKASLSSESNCLAVTADIRCSRSCEDFARAAFGWQQRVDVWVNNAGADVLTTELKNRSFEEKLETLLQVDVMGTIRLSRLAAERLTSQSRAEGRKPCIIHVGWDQSMTGMEGEAGQLFCTTKAAVEAFSKALALTIGPDVRVNTVAPGWIKTKWGENTQGYWERRARSESILQRWGKPSDVANAIAWLASEAAEFINGQTIDINGGFRVAEPAPKGG